MLKQKIPCCYYPTTVFLVDDEKSFLSNLVLKIDRSIPCVISDNPQNALLDINNRCNEKVYLNDVLENVYDNESELDYSKEQIIKVNTHNIHKIIYDKNRFNTVSTVIVDYDMPYMNGVEFCKNIQKFSIKKILLTGKATYETAVNAFNNNVIDGFILKNSDNLYENIKNSINDAQWKYFLQKFKYITDNISIQLSNEFFSIFWYELFNKIAPTEFYLLDNFGSFLFLDINANPTYFLVKSDKELCKYYEMAKDNYAPDNILNKLETKKFLPFFYTDDDQNLSVEQWDKHLYPAHALPHTSYYYSIINDRNLLGGSNAQVFSYKDYLAVDVR